MKLSRHVLAPVVLAVVGLCACSRTKVQTKVESPGVTNMQPSELQPPKPERGAGCFSEDTPCSYHHDCCSGSCMNSVCVINEP